MKKIETIAQEFNTCSSPPKIPAPQILIDKANWFTALLEQIGALEEDILTDSQKQSLLWISKKLETTYKEFKAYYYEILAGLESDKEAALEQVVFDKQQSKAMVFINRSGNLLAKPQPISSTPVSTNICLVDKATSKIFLVSARPTDRNSRISGNFLGVSGYIYRNYASYYKIC